MKLIVGALTAALVVVTGCSHGQSRMNHHAWGISQAELDADTVASGGRGYDKWWVEYGQPAPLTAHPSYPAVGKATGADTWRCKECHGWDYRGNDGAYGKGGHFTGIAGITEAVGKPVATLLATLKDKTHRFDTVLPSSALEKIALFAAQGQIDMRTLINDQTKAATGGTDTGLALYDNHCAGCHGDNGKGINFASADKPPEYVGTVARENPWEALHKLRNSHPGAFVEGHMGGGMGGMRGKGMGRQFMPPMHDKLTPAEQAGLLAHLQTLPAD